MLSQSLAEAQKELRPLTPERWLWLRQEPKIYLRVGLNGKLDERNDRQDGETTSESVALPHQEWGTPGLGIRKMYSV